MHIRTLIESILDDHFEYARAGFPLPDRDDLRKYPSGHIGHPIEGGHVEFHRKNINRRFNMTCLYNDKNKLHCADGPAVIIHNDHDPQDPYNETSHFIHGRHVKGPYPF